MLDEGVHATLEDLAKSEGRRDATYVSRVLRLTLLAPDIVEAILDGRQPAELQLDDLLEGFPVDWEGNETTSRSTAGSRGLDVESSSIAAMILGNLTAIARGDRNRGGKALELGVVR